MQGSILYIDQKQGFIQGDDKNRYYFTETDWYGDDLPTMGQIVTFRPDAPNARDISPLPTPVMSLEEQPQTLSGTPANSVSSNIPPPFDTQSKSSEATVTKQVYNVPTALATLLLFISLVMPYGEYGYSTFRLVDSGLGAFYYVFPFLLFLILILGAPRLWALVLAGVSLLASLAAFTGQNSLFSQVSNARQQVDQMTAATDGLLGSQFGNQMQNAVPSLTDLLTGGFYLHVISLLALAFLLFLRRYEVRTGGVTLETIGSAAEAGAQITAQTGRIMVANAERLTGQTVPTAGQTGNFLRHFLSFDRMIAPTIITFTYYIYLVLIVLVGIGMLISGLFLTRYGGSGIAFAGIVLLLLGPLWLRLFAEFLIVVFKIHDQLVRIDDKTAPLPVTTQPPEQA